MKRDCKHQVRLGDKVVCMHSDHALFQQAIKCGQDCKGCRLKVSPLVKIEHVATEVEMQPLSMVEKLRSLAKVVFDPTPASKNLQDERLAICYEPCTYKRGKRCRLCTCNVKIKVRYKNAECPKGKW